MCVEEEMEDKDSEKWQRHCVLALCHLVLHGCGFHFSLALAACSRLNVTLQHIHTVNNICALWKNTLVNIADMLYSVLLK